MAVTTDILKLTAWVQANICNGYKLKQPSDETPGESYDYKKVNPTAYPIYIPTQEQLPEGVETIYPCILVTFKEGTDRPIEGRRTTKIQLIFCIWDPGQHGADIYTPDGTGHYTQGTEKTFKRTTDGWQSLINFMDFAKRIITNAEYIDGMRVMLEDGITYSLTNPEDSFNRELYPYYAGVLTFDLTTGIEALNASYSEML